MKVLLVSTYELGHQPVGLAAMAALLSGAGHRVEIVDLSIEPFRDDLAESVDAVVFSVPMHTATELALEAATRLRRRRPGLRLGFVGLYAPVLEGHPALGPDDLLAAGEVAGPLRSWLEASGRDDPADAAAVSARGPSPVVDLGPAKLPAGALPARQVLAPLERYVRFEKGGSSAVAASVEASRGCNHRCGHCPVASVYRGRSRSIAIEAVLADVAQVVEMGATHVSFADPDFLNRPRHATEVAEVVHSAFPSVSFDATIKVEHLIRHRDLLDGLVTSGLAFVTSAFESTDDDVLAIFEKGHVAAEEKEAVALVRAAGAEIRPSWLPFSPWTTLASIASLLRLSAEADLVGSTDPVQYSIRLLLPKGSLLLARPDPVLTEAVAAAGGGGFGSVAWRHRDRRLDALQAELSGIVEGAPRSPAGFADTFAEIWSLARSAGAPLGPEPPAPDPALASRLAAPDRPRLSEAWFCCAEPTGAQLELVRR